MHLSVIKFRSFKNNGIKDYSYYITVEKITLGHSSFYMCGLCYKCDKKEASNNAPIKLHMVFDYAISGY